MQRARIGVIGGSGLYDMDGLTGVSTLEVDTPFGKPSDKIVLGALEGVMVAFLPRHGRGHRIGPSELPSRANIYALKSLGVEAIIAVNAVGSLKEEYRPGDIVLPDQLIDRTNGRQSSFFGDGLVAHVAFAEPFCSTLRRTLFKAAEETGVTAHHGGTLVVMEGPAFSTRAECNLHRSWGADLIGMTPLPEAKLAREAEICYATLACVTDYDCWRESCEPVTADMILAGLQRNVHNAKRIIRLAVSNLSSTAGCACSEALKCAIATDPVHVPAETKNKLRLLIGKYIK